MKKFFTTFISIFSILQVQLFITLNAMATEQTSQVETYLLITHKHLTSSINKLNTVQERNIEGLYSQYKNNPSMNNYFAEISKLSSTEKALNIPQIIKNKTGYEWSITEGVTFSFSENDLIVGKVYVNNQPIIIPQTDSPVELMQEFQKSFNALNLDKKTTSLMNYFISDAQATPLFVLALYVFVGFMAVMAIDIKYANAATPELQCIQNNDCDCLKALGKREGNLDSIISKLQDKNISTKKLKSIDPMNESCATDLTEVLNVAKKDKKIEFAGYKVSDVAKKICQSAKFAKECDNNKSPANHDSHKRDLKEKKTSDDFFPTPQRIGGATITQ